MQASIPPLLHRYALWFDAAPVPASLVAIALAIVALALLRMAMKFFLVFLALLAVLILGSYLFMGEDETGELLQDGVYEVVDPPEGSDHEAAEGGEAGEEGPEPAPGAEVAPGVRVPEEGTGG